MILVDSHVHFYSCFELRSFLDAASDNFRRAAARWSADASYQSVLLLTETAEDSWFQEISQNSGDTSSSWYFRRNQDMRSVNAHHPKRQPIVIVAGRQIITKESLEVLALGTTRQFSDGHAISTVLDQVNDADAIAVIPWAFGKWIGERGQIIRELLEQNGEIAPFVLGDNSARLRFFPDPAIFQLAKESGIPILPGSDPLPFRSETRRAGSFGFRLDGELSDECPSADILRLIRNNGNITPYGKLENPFRFLRNQIAMQIVKRTQQGDNG